MNKHQLTREEMFKKYLEHAEAYISWQKLDNGDNPDEQFMRSIEEKVGISVNACKAFREEIMIRASAYARKGLVFNWESHERLKAALLSLIQEDTHEKE